ncbi:hypothetical protein JX266_011473 [Neoarthrinium moseri]|nr:hypothetical protein JX266_011473 [Neoarthrinium moseri]
MSSIPTSSAGSDGSLGTAQAADSASPAPAPAPVQLECDMMGDSDGTAHGKLIPGLPDSVVPAAPGGNAGFKIPGMTADTVIRETPAVKDTPGRVILSGYYRGSFVCGHRKLTDQSQPCSAIMKNQAHNIRSHVSKQHNGNSAYQRYATADMSGGLPCGEVDCNQTFSNRHNLIRHLREVHRLRNIKGQPKQY